MHEPKKMFHQVLKNLHFLAKKEVMFRLTLSYFQPTHRIDHHCTMKSGHITCGIICEKT